MTTTSQHARARLKNNIDNFSVISDTSEQKISTKCENKRKPIHTPSKSAKFSEKNRNLNSETWDFMNNVGSNEPKDASDRTVGIFENYLSYVTNMYFGGSDNMSKTTLNDLSLKLNSGTQEAGGVSNDTNNQLSGQNESPEGLQSNCNFYYSTLDMLCNPIRVSQVFENWSPREIAIFESCICKFGK